MDTKKAKNVKKMLVRYGKMGYLGWFSHYELELPMAPRKVIIKTDRGLEMGEMIGIGCYKHGNYKGAVTSLTEYFEVAPEEYPIGHDGQFVRFANHQDINEARHVRESATDELDICRRHVQEYGLQMKIVDFEHIFGGERIVFYFVSDGRVDFRDLVKNLAKEFQTRIEMRQIGARDEARLISDIETCGQQCCCSKYLKILKPVNMRMAKTQKATLDPSKISGHCGRLRCCLRYEDETYQQLKSCMPNRQSWVSTPSGEGRVLDYQILTQLVQVQFEDGKIEAIPFEDITVLPGGPTGKPHVATGGEGRQCQNKCQSCEDEGYHDEMEEKFKSIRDHFAADEVDKDEDAEPKLQAEAAVEDDVEIVEGEFTPQTAQKPSGDDKKKKNRKRRRRRKSEGGREGGSAS